MRWPVLKDVVRLQPEMGTWRDWKTRIADDCSARCVYCAIPESRFGGSRNFHIEHFRPKARFPSFENAISNLYLACAVCNVLKCDDWPGAPRRNHSTAAYPDPARTDYNILLSLSPSTHEVTSRTVAGKYLIERLLLNRAQLVLERRLTILVQMVDEFKRWAEPLLDEMTAEEVRATFKWAIELDRIAMNALASRPYRDTDTKGARKPRVSKKQKRS